MNDTGQRRGHAPSLGFRFTEAEEAAMARAMREAGRYMRAYGAGREPFTVDLRHYENTLCRETACDMQDETEEENKK